ncbi:MAG: heme-binding domain-containing protein [Oligoflexales bacterium]
MKFAFLIMAALIAGEGFAHGSHKHGTEEGNPTQVEEQSAHEAALPPDVFAEAKVEYLNSVKPIFQKKCFDCHSQATVYPWYYKIPGVKQYIDADIREALHHLDFSQDFPFKSHGTPYEDLDAIKEKLQQGEMPPQRYVLLHPDAQLTPAELDAVFRWVDRAHASKAP